MNIKSLDAIPKIEVSDETIARHIAERALEADLNARLRGKALSRYEITQALWIAAKKRGANAVGLYNRVVGHPAFRAAMI